MKESSIFKMVAVPVSIATVILGIGFGIGSLLSLMILPDRPSTPPAVPGRYVVAASDTSGIWIVDAATGHVRICAADEAALVPTCGDWRTE